jgi:phosphomevalonate kinase
MTQYYHKTQLENKLLFCEMVEQFISTSNSSVFVVADLRHHFEQEYFQKIASDQLRLITIRLTLPNSVRSQRGWVESPIDSDETETNLDNQQVWDHVYDNTGTISQLREFTENFMQSI